MAGWLGLCASAAGCVGLMPGQGIEDPTRRMMQLPSTPSNKERASCIVLLLCNKPPQM